MKIIVTTPGKWKNRKIRKEIVIPTVHKCTLVMALKWIIFQLEEIPFFNQRLFYKGNRRVGIYLRTAGCLGDYGIEDGSVLSLHTTEKIWSTSETYDGRPIKLPYPYHQLVRIFEYSNIQVEENQTKEVKKMIGIEKILDAGKYGPIVVILSFFEEIDLLMNVIHVNEFFYDLVFELWENGNIQPDRNYKDSGEASRLNFFYFVLGFINEDVFLKLISLKESLQKPFTINPSRLSRYFIARSSAGNIWHLNQFLLDHFHRVYDLTWLRICIDRNYLEVLKVFIKKYNFRLQKYHVPFPYLGRCFTLKRSKEMIHLVLEERRKNGEKSVRPFLLLPKGIIDFLYEEGDVDLKRITGLLEHHNHEMKGNIFNFRKVVLKFVESVKRGSLNGSLEEFLRIEQHFPNFILKYKEKENGVRVYKKREDTYVHRDDIDLEQEFSYVHANKRIFPFLNYHLHLFQWDLMEYLITKDFGVWKHNHRRKFKISRQMKQRKELEEFVLGLEGGEFHNFDEEEIESWKKELLKRK